MNKKLLGAVLGTLAFGGMTVAAQAEETKPADAKPAKAKKGHKGGDKTAAGDKAAGEKSCSGDKKAGEKSCSGDKKGGEKSCSGEKGCAGKK